MRKVNVSVLPRFLLAQQIHVENLPADRLLSVCISGCMSKFINTTALGVTEPAARSE
jgi:hypothetical protein